MIMSSPSIGGRLPTSSAPGGTPNSSSLPQSRTIINPLAFDNVRGLAGTQGSINGGDGRRGDDEAEDEDEMVARRRGGGRRRMDDTDAIPRVKDTTGEKVMESFALFLEK
jgi:DNA replication licensing factor MCM6